MAPEQELDNSIEVARIDNKKLMVPGVGVVGMGRANVDNFETFYFKYPTGEKKISNLPEATRNCEFSVKIKLHAI